ncbi:vinorine synthase-like protein, partial [Trifolium pratense]
VVIPNVINVEDAIFALTLMFPTPYLGSGRRKDQTFITCNDEGAVYLEAKVNHTMVEFLNPPKLEFLNKLLPCEPNKMHQNGEDLPQVLVQVNMFNCGGIAIGTCHLHTLLDGCSGSLFQTTWAAICRGCSSDELPHPDFFTASSCFPTINHVSKNTNESFDGQKKCSTRRFVFGSESIDTLRDKAKDDDDNDNDDGRSKFPTRYEALAAFIWKHMTLACKMEGGVDSKRPTLAIHIVDMRRRMGSNECVDLPQGIETISPIPVVLTSWCGLNFSELDFGWGKPFWVGVRGGDQETLPNVAVIMETNEGMEAWVTMEMQHIANLENDMEFLKLALSNPSVSNV